MDLFHKYYDQICKAIIRPPREQYRRSDLGSSNFSIGEIQYKRIDINMKNDRNKNIQCSFYKMKKNRTSQSPVIIYLHGNSSSRLSGINILKQVLPQFNVVTFDFSGSGRSEGEYVSLGYHQKQDIKTVINYLKQQQKVTQIILWGRSMGAVTAILYAAKYKDVKGLILDSAFTDLQKVMYQIADSQILMPDFVVKYFITTVQETIKQKMLATQKYEFDILKLKPNLQMPKIKIPVMFICGKQDKLIRCEHTQQLFQNCLSRHKQLHIIEGGHNGNRTSELKFTILKFIKKVLGIVNHQHKKISPNHTSKRDHQINTSLNQLDFNIEFDQLLKESKKIIQKNKKLIQENEQQLRVKKSNKTRRNRIFSKS